MSGSFGTLQRTLIGSNLNLGGQNGIDQHGDLKVGNGLIKKNLRVMKSLSVGGSSSISGDLRVKGNIITNENTEVNNITIINDTQTTHLTVNGNTQLNLLQVDGAATLNNVSVNGLLDLNHSTLISDHIDNTYALIKVFEGTTVNVGDQVEHVLYTQTNHSRSIIELKVFIHDVNSNTFWRYSDGKYMWYREWTTDAQELILGTPIDVGSGSPLEYVIDRFQNNNDITVRITQNTPIDTNTKYKIIAKIIQNNF